MMASFKNSNKKINVPNTNDTLDIHYALKPVNYTFFFFGLQSYSYRANTPIKKTSLSKAYSLLFLSSMILLSFYQIQSKIKYEIETSTLKIAMTDNIAYLFVIFTVILLQSCPVFCNPQLPLKYLNNIKYIDQILELSPECYKTMRKYNIFISVFLSLNDFFVVMFDMFSSYSTQSLFYIPLYIAIFIVDFLIFQCALYIWMVTFRMRALVFQLACCNKQLMSSDDHIDFSPNNKFYVSCWNKMNKSVTNYDVIHNFDGRILTLMMIYDKLADNVDIINSSYGVQVRYKVFCIYL